MTPKKIILLSLFLTFIIQGYSQNSGQILRGTIVDQITRQPIPFANVILSDSLATISDADGVFRFSEIRVGKYSLRVCFLGYEEIFLRNIDIDSGKEAIYNLKMAESPVTMDEIVVSVAKEKSQPLNEMSLLSTRMVGVEETKKYASAFNDPARMANSFAGVVQTDAGSNHISIRGNAPNGLLWRLEGVEIPNPNHFSTVGSSGGGVSILSGQLLANSDFSTGAFAAEYGNALSGVFDIKLRKGNDEKREHTLQIGVLGIDLASEGPLSEKGSNSYLINYRYSTLGILSRVIDLGGYVTTFQDLSYNLSFKNKKIGDITFFGLNGLSSQTGYDSIYLYDLDFVANTLVNGVTHSKTIGKNSFLKSVLVLSQTKNKIKATEEDIDSKQKYVGYDEGHKNTSLIFSTKFQHKLSPSSSLKIGLIQNLLSYDEYKSEQESLYSTPEQFYNQDGSTATTQAYAQILNRPNKRLTSSFGIHYLYNWLNNTRSIEPRLALKYATTPKQFLSVGYGLHSQLIPLGTHFVEIQKGDILTYPNKTLCMSKAHHFVLGYNYKPSQLLSFKLETYYQHLFDIPQGIDPEENESILNMDYNPPNVEMNNDGVGRNYGIEFTMEKFLDKGYYLTGTTSFFSSKYKGLDGNWYNTRFDGGFASSITGGKEFTLSKAKKRTMGIHFKSIYTGGMRQSPIDVAASYIKDETVYDHSNPFSNQLPNYFRFDLKVSFKRNYKHTTTSLVFDIQNITNRQNAGYDDYNPSTNEVERFTQIGMLPVISYKIEF